MVVELSDTVSLMLQQRANRERFGLGDGILLTKNIEPHIILSHGHSPKLIIDALQQTH